jgi:hypothetical protein
VSSYRFWGLGFCYYRVTYCFVEIFSYLSFPPPRLSISEVGTYIFF